MTSDATPRAPIPSESVPRVSIVVPSYNNAGFIEATMDSVLGQTFEDFELVVADHSSSDGTWRAITWAVDALEQDVTTVSAWAGTPCGAR